MESDKVLLGPPEVAEMSPPEGFHNTNFDESRVRLLKGGSYRDSSTVCLMPTPSDGKLNYKISDALKTLMVPMNGKFTHMRMTGMEVADAYNNGVQAILDNPELSKWKFVLTWEHDNLPPPDGLLKLLEAMFNGPWACVGGLYWTKGEGGQPMIYGDPKDPEVNYRPQVPQPDTVQECRGTGMGFNLWDMDIFRDVRLGPPWFRTVQVFDHNGVRAGTQDLDFCGRATALGYRFAVDTGCRVGHVQFDASQTHPAGFVW